jgi:hypothetical protein
VVQIRTQSILHPVIDVAELNGPEPGFVWLMPWKFSIRFKSGPGGALETSTQNISDFTMGLILQKRSDIKNIGDRNEIQALQQTRLDDDDETPDEQLRRLQQEVYQEGAIQQGMGDPLPSSFQSPDDEGFLLMVRKKSGDVDAFGRETATSPLRMVKEAWLNVDPRMGRVRLYPSPMLFPNDPLWVFGTFVRHWLSKWCIPYLSTAVRARPGRPRGLKLAIPAREPTRSIAIQWLQEVFANEAEAERKCRLQTAQQMTISEAVFALGLWDAVAGSPVTRRKRIQLFGLRPGATDEELAKAILFAARAGKPQFKSGVVTVQQNKAARSAINSVATGVTVDRLRKARDELLRVFDPVNAQSPGQEDLLKQWSIQVQSAYDRLMMVRLLARNPITLKGPRLGNTSKEEQLEAQSIIGRVFTFDPRTGRVGINRDAPWRLGSSGRVVKKDTLDLVLDSDGNLLVGESTIGENLSAWIVFLWGTRDERGMVVPPAGLHFDLDGLDMLASRVFYDRI